MPGGGPLAPGADGLYKRHASAGASANPRHPPLSSGKVSAHSQLRRPATSRATGGGRFDRRADGLARQLQMPQHTQLRRQDLRLLFAPRRRGERPQGHLAAALLHEGAAREPLAPRGRPLRHQGRHRGGRGLARRQGHRGQGDRLPARAGSDAGLHGRAGGRRPRCHARRHEGARRRPAEDQPARPRRPRHRPFGDRRRVRHADRRSRATSSTSTSATSSATTS